MVTIIAKLKAVPGKETFLAEQCEKMAETVREKEADCLEYVPYVSVEDATVIVFVETYRDAAAFDYHLTTPYFKEFVDTITPILAGKLDVRRFDE
ncbi:MAG: putative quinol monooxygenase [Bacillota bacterium]|nr:putative quinol monooxygenase [Bacillota bacterium]MDW7684507.1 putative quinol monooxygenase [Bacillota bacterium]